LKIDFRFVFHTFKISQIILPLFLMSKNKNILVTGGAGYIGSHTIVALVNAGYSPVILDDFRNSDEIVIQRLNQLTGSNIPYISVDICEKALVFEKLNDYSFVGVIHFAAYKAVGESVHQPLKYYHNNIASLVNIVDWCIEKEVNNFVFSSSCTVYGEPKNVREVDENAALGEANSPYGQTKIIGEQILQDVYDSGSPLKIMNLRYFNPVGAHPSGLIGELPKGKPTNLLPFVTQTAVGIHKELTVFGNDYPTEDGTCKRDYIHVMDLADAHVKALEYLVKNSSPSIDFINIGTGKSSSILEVIKTFERVSQQSLSWKFGSRRSGDVVEIYANASKAKDLFDWQAKLSLEDAIRDAWNWEQKLRNERENGE